MAVRIGARWDDPVQNDRVRRAYDTGAIDYIEVNYPVPYNSAPHEFGIPVLAHTSSNPTCSAQGINRNIARLVRDGANATDSPWIGEHLSWLGTAQTGSLGYQINPLFTEEFAQIAALNVTRLRDFYERPVALELGPIYTGATGFESEMHFLGRVSEAADTGVILDVTHWQIANRNLERPGDYGLDAIDPARIIELHVAGMRCGADGRFWHDAHELPPNDDVLDWTARLVRALPVLEAVTFEHNPAAPEADFFACLDEVARVVGEARAA
ncbi:MAG: DUF692 family multinuclear iron-containing protein [Alphaproteobacteria bacterium]